MSDTIILIYKSVWYHSPHDEDAFFEWIKKIPAIVRYEGKHDTLYLHVSNNMIGDDDLRELLAIFYRYKIKNMNQLNVFLTAANQHWFYDNKKAYWHKKVFGAYEKQK